MGAGALFNFSSGQDFKNSNMDIAQFDQGGLGLPDRDYYLKTDPKSAEIRAQYLAHMQKMFELSGEAAARAKADAATVMAIETALAKGSMDRVEQRDPHKVYHKITVAELQALGPDFRWTEYFRGTNAPPFTSLNVSEPDFVKAMAAEIQAASLPDLKPISAGTCSILPRRFCPPLSSMRISISTAGHSPAPPRFSRAGSAASNSPTASLGKPWAASMSSACFRPRPRPTL